jgi:hypothetical protein
MENTTIWQVTKATKVHEQTSLVDYGCLPTLTPALRLSLLAGWHSDLKSG